MSGRVAIPTPDPAGEGYHGRWRDVFKHAGLDAQAPRRFAQAVARVAG